MTMPGSLTRTTTTPESSGLLGLLLIHRKRDGLTHHAKPQLRAGAGDRGVPVPDGDDFPAAGVAVVRDGAGGKDRRDGELEPHRGFGAEVVRVHHRAADGAVLGNADLL